MKENTKTKTMMPSCKRISKRQIPKNAQQLYQKALDIFDRDMPVIPVHQESIPKLVKSYVKGYVPNAMNVNYSKNMYIAAH